MILDELLGGPFDTVLDIGGNVGDFAEQAVTLWPDAKVVSFEPVPHVADVNARRANGRWQTLPIALSDTRARREIRYCVNQHSASTLERPGSVRRELFGLDDRYELVEIETMPLDDYLRTIRGRTLVKIDVEGHEGAVLAGGRKVLDVTSAVICEVQNGPDVYQHAAPVALISRFLAGSGLIFAGLIDVLHAPGDGRVLQFDGVWRRT